MSSPPGTYSPSIVLVIAEVLDKIYRHPVVIVLPVVSTIHLIQLSDGGCCCPRIAHSFDAVLVFNRLAVKHSGGPKALSLIS